MADLEKIVLLDSRTVELNLKRKLISRQDVEKHLKSLPDESEFAAELVIDEDDLEDEA